MSTEEYNYINQYRSLIDLFVRTGQYVGGGSDLLDFLKVPNKRCPSCIAKALIEVNERIKEYENNLQSMSTNRQ